MTVFHKFVAVLLCLTIIAFILACLSAFIGVMVFSISYIQGAI